MPPHIPPFEALPLHKDGPHGNAWGLFGEQDELGMLNRLTPTTTIAATKEIIHGIRISTDLPLDEPKPPCFGRAVFHQYIYHKAPRTVNDDTLTLNTQSSTQWDGFRHHGYQHEKVYFNGCQQSDIHENTRIGINVWVENGGVVGRGVLLNYYSWSLAQGKEPEVLATTKITSSELDQVAASEGISFQPGDILFIRTGFVKALRSMDRKEAEIYVAVNPPDAIGIESSKETLRWIWDNGFAAVAGDQPAFEPLPFQSTEFSLHEWLLAGWGLPIGELFNLEQLAEECKKHNKWSFFFSSMPLRVPGGIASPPNGVAIL